MSEENRNEDQSWREVAVSGVSFPVKVKEDAAAEHGLVSPEMQQRTRNLGEQAVRSLEEREKSGKVNADELISKRGEKDLQEFHSRELRLWKARGGSAEEFNAEWPRIKADHIRRENEELYRNASSPY